MRFPKCVLWGPLALCCGVAPTSRQEAEGRGGELHEDSLRKRKREMPMLGQREQEKQGEREIDRETDR